MVRSVPRSGTLRSKAWYQLCQALVFVVPEKGSRLIGYSIDDLKGTAKNVVRYLQKGRLVRSKGLSLPEGHGDRTADPIQRHVPVPKTLDPL